MLDRIKQKHKSQSPYRKRKYKKSDAGSKHSSAKVKLWRQGLTAELLIDKFREHLEKVLIERKQIQIRKDAANP